MNVLVYSGPEVLSSSLSHCVTSLRTALVPNYAVQSVTRQSLSTQTWLQNCALLVFPACRSAPFDSALKSTVERYVLEGGRLLTIGATVKVQTRETISNAGLHERLFKMALAEQNTALLFSDKSSGIKVSVSFEGLSIENTQLVTVSLGDLRVDGLPCMGSCQGVDGAESAILEPVARFAGDGTHTGVSTTKLSYGRGRAVFCASLIDHPLTEEPLLSRLKVAPSSMTDDQLQNAERRRQQLLQSTLRSLGLIPPEKTSEALSPLPQFLTCPPSKTWIVDRVLAALTIDPDALLPNKPVELQDSNDTFQYHLASDEWQIVHDAREHAKRQTDPSSWNPKHVLICRMGLLPSSEQTPIFDTQKFHDDLSTARRDAGLQDKEGAWGMGEALLYGEVVTSTQTMLDKNTRLLSALPTPLVSLASHQLAGRGRGTNIWLSPSGCLQFSLLLRVSLSDFPASKLVFVQYLFGLAVVEACRDAGVLGEGGKWVRLKWPNDVYVVFNDGGRKKIGGILVNTSFSGGKVDIVIGSGLNVFNPPPIQSLLQLIPSQSNISLTMERTAAIILAKFEELWTTFLQHNGSFEPFLELYYDRWLHSDQLVELTTVTPPQMVRIVGITSDHGLLRTMPERDGWSGGGDGTYVDLQPDGNSFDLMAGLIKAKT